MGQLVGREPEMVRLHGFLVRLGRDPSAVVVEGEPGIGKTALLEAVLAEVAEPQVLVARCAEAEAGLAYAGLVDLLGRVTEPVLEGVGVAAAPGA